MKAALFNLILIGALLHVSFAMSSETATTQEGECKPKPFIIPLPYKVGSVSSEYVLEGETFSSKEGAGASGTMKNNGAVTITPSASDQNIPEGYHNGSGAVPGDGDLVSGNIKAEAEIFGVAGDANVVDTSDGDAVAGELMAGKKAYVGGKEVIGSMETQTLSADNETVSAGNYAETTLSEVDKDLVSANILSGKTIFGIVGNTNVVNTEAGDAVAGDIKYGQVAYVDGASVTGSIMTHTLDNESVSVAAGYYEETTLSEVDADLVMANIKDGIEIFGVSGTLEPNIKECEDISDFCSGTSPNCSYDEDEHAIELDYVSYADIEEECDNVVTNACENKGRVLASRDICIKY